MPSVHLFQDRFSCAWPGVTAVCSAGFRLAQGARCRDQHVNDDRSGLGVFLFGNGGESAQELVGDVGEDGGAASRDFVLRGEKEQAREEVVDLGGGCEVAEVGGEGRGDFGGIGRGRSGSGLRVFGAERLAAEAERTATHAVGEAMVAASRIIDGPPDL
jgi:hypothetical protein